MVLPEMPDEVWKVIFQYMPQDLLLGSCSLVSKDWQRRAAAAIASTELLARTGQGLERWELFQAWSTKHGQHLSSLKLTSFKNLL
jgi:hypothetical protein